MKTEKAIEVLFSEISHAELDISNGEGNTHTEEFVEAGRMAIRLLKKEIPKKPVFHEERHEHHSWIKDEDGEIDNFAMEYEYHNGPICEFCGYSFCEHCNPDGYNDTNCYISWHTCPTCGTSVCKSNKRCQCGQVLDWKEDEEENDNE